MVSPPFEVNYMICISQVSFYYLHTTNLIQVTWYTRNPCNTFETNTQNSLLNQSVMWFSFTQDETGNGTRNSAENMELASSTVHSTRSRESTKAWTAIEGKSKLSLLHTFFFFLFSWRFLWSCLMICRILFLIVVISNINYSLVDDDSCSMIYRILFRNPT